MKKYVKDNYYKIYNDDCLNILKKFKDKSIDCTITSPPYNLNLRYHSGRFNQHKEKDNKITSKYSNYDDNMTMEEYFKFTDKVIKQLLRISKYTFYNIQMVNGNKSALFKILGKYSDYIKDIIIWDKINGQPSIQKNVLNSVFEFIFVFTDDEPIKRGFNKYYFKQGTLNNIWRIKPKKSINNNHKATFPLELVNTIIDNFTEKNDIILDCFMGTGTTGVASIQKNRNFIGIELSKEYYNTAKKRLEENTISLF